MKVLFVTSRASFTDQVIKAFEANTAKIFYLDDRENMVLPWPLRNNKFLWRVARRIQPLRVLSNRLFAEKLIRTAEKLKPDLVLFNKTMIVKKDTLAVLRSMGIKTANWFVDNVNHKLYRSWFLNNYKFYDHFFIFDSGAKELVKNQPESSRVSYLPMAIDPATFKQGNLSEEDKKKYSCDVCFVGALYPERERALTAIKGLGVNLKIYGWRGWEKTPLASYYHGPLDVKETVKLYSCAKICLNMNLEPACSGVNLKTFEIPAAGGFQLSDYRKDIEGLFITGKEIEIFRDENELREKIIFYLKNSELAKNIALAGMGRVLRDHTFKKRVAEMLKITCLD